MVSVVLDEPRCRLRFFFDSGAGCCLWTADEPTRDAFGYPIVGSLPVADDIAQHLADLCAEFDTALNWDSPSDSGPWRAAQCEAFNKRADKTRHAIAAELGPEWEVVDQFRPIIEDPDLDRYLAQPESFRRQRRR